MVWPLHVHKHCEIKAIHSSLAVHQCLPCSMCLYVINTSTACPYQVYDNAILYFSATLLINTLSYHSAENASHPLPPCDHPAFINSTHCTTLFEDEEEVELLPTPLWCSCAMAILLIQISQWLMRQPDHVWRVCLRKCICIATSSCNGSIGLSFKKYSI